MRRGVVSPFTLLLFAFLISATACSSVRTESKPTILIVSPASGSEFHAGDDIAIQSTASDPAGIVRVELLVDDLLVRTDSSPSAQGPAAVTLTQTWKATPGTHILLVRAYNAAGNVSNPAAIAVIVSQVATPTATITLTPTVIPSPISSPTISAGCTDNAVFVADVTVPDGTLLAPGQTFNKIWRVRNAGCPWEAGYQLVFVNGEAMSTTRVFPLPSTANGATADLLVAMTAPTAPGAHTGTWRLRNPKGVLFGTIVTVVITVLGAASPTNVPAPTACSGTPTISSFTASPMSVTAGGTTTLNWGPVTNADSVEIDQGIGGVGTPGSYTVTLMSSMTYTLTARCGSETATAQVRILVPFAITGSSVTADTGDYTGACPKTVNFSAVITVNDAGPVTFKWESSDGTNNSGPVTINFANAGSQTVGTAWTLGSAGRTLSNYWERLHILSPTDVISNEATFTLRCN